MKNEKIDPRPTEGAALLDVREAAWLLRLFPGTLYHMVAEGRVPCIRLSRRCLRFRRSDLDEWVTEHFEPGENAVGR
ncbi:MAG: helix-turn-helix domain-containing protein [Acidobacteriia bacterium]|nr:helix-turn-helix domain-containing protein [Terriglobia bacterium]